MPRYYHSPSLDIHHIAEKSAVSDDDYKRLVANLEKHHPITHPASDRLVKVGNETHLKVPEMYCRRDTMGNVVQATLPWKRGSIAFGLPSYGFWVVPPGGHVDLDLSIPEKAVKDAAPHLLTEAEHQIAVEGQAQAAPEKVEADAPPVVSKKKGKAEEAASQT
jgi:hypothetical protein